MSNKREETKGIVVHHKQASSQCEEFVILLAEYWERDTTAGLKAEIHRHIRHCVACAEIFESYRRTIIVCRTEKNAPHPAPSHRQLWDGLSSQIQVLHDYLD